MKILITNDDGIHAKGIAALSREISKRHDVMVVAPDTERSGASHSITLTYPLRVRRALISGLENVDAYMVNGAPADCVIVACKGMGFRPDVVLSGINHGYNLGTDVHYSGTVNAAAEGALMGIPSMAVSMRYIDSEDFSSAARIAAELLTDLVNSGNMLYNLNVPDLIYDEIKGIKYTALSSRNYLLPFEKRCDPRGNDYYWWPKRLEYDGDMAEDNDERWTMEGYAAVTPMLINATDRTALSRLCKR